MRDQRWARRQIGTLGPDEARIAFALRQWVMLRQAGRCPMTALAGRLGSLRAAAHMQLMLEEIGAAWPEPFAVSPQCCACLSHDEATLVDMVALAARGDRPGFDRLLADLLPGDERERLFDAGAALVRAIAEARRPKDLPSSLSPAGRELG
jgi:hypothetical protein